MPVPAPPDAGLYVHVPFCRRICPYCDFAVTTSRPERRARWVDALLAEIALAADWRHPLDTVYLGGGTPSLLDDEQLARLLEGLRPSLPVLPGARLTLEANPEDVDRARLRAWRALGLHTLSLGLQSLDDAELRFLGRRHTAAQAREAAELALSAGFPSVSLDLIYGLPGQDRATWRRNLDRVLDLGAPHLSAYQLSCPEGTPFGRRLAEGRLPELDDATRAERFVDTHTRLAGAGYQAYEVSNFARAPEHRSRHNRKYWDHTPYLGLGPGAHSFLGNRRWWNERRLAGWEERIAAGERPVAGSETLAARDLAHEALLLGLRTPEGIDLDGYRGRHGIDLLEAAGRLVRTLSEQALVQVADRRLRPTLAGLAVADGLAARLAADLDGWPRARGCRRAAGPRSSVGG